MCTLTVVTGNDRYFMAMNRDEKITRSPGLFPEIHEFDGIRAIYPNDGDGGTWFATNECGITFALLNWNNIAPCGIDANTQSRGVSNFKGMMPFRLVGVFPSDQEIWEWRWDSLQLDFEVHAWESRHWFSSSLSDERAESLRRAACRSAQHESDAGSVPWLRRLHASHAGGPGPFSLCVHRQHVKTLSYSEVMVTPKYTQMSHFRGSPCTMAQIRSIEIERADCQDPVVWGAGSSAI